MDQQPQQTSSTDIETVEWFDSLPGPIQKPKKKPQVVFLTVGIVAFVAIGFGIWLILNQPKKCLTTANLTELTGLTDSDPVTNPATYFFSYPIEFNPTTASYNINAEQTGPQIIMKLSDFYKNHPDSSIIMTISSDYFKAGDDALANQRIGLIKNDLIAADIPADHITSLKPTQNDPENDTEQATSASVAITSASSCRQ